jgi:hypothetical protein
VDVIDLEDDCPRPLLLDLSSEQTAVLDQLCLYHEKGFGHPRVVAKLWRIVFLMACLLAASVGLVVFARRIPPFFSTMLCGLFLGSILTNVRHRLAFERQWPLLEAIIDWKLAGRLRREAVIPGDQDA